MTSSPQTVTRIGRTAVRVTVACIAVAALADCVPDEERHSVVCRQRAVCSVARHSAVTQPRP